ncbi:MAG TPA: PIN domain-containing protein [Terrimicrobiaceae bacterium]
MGLIGWLARRSTTVLRFVDTNVLLYSVSRDPEEVAKRQRAIEILDARGLCLSVQVLQEFYVQATRRGRADALSHEQAVGFVRVWCRFPVQESNMATLQRSLETTERYRISYWDAAVVEAARAGGCRELLSEDFQHGQDFHGVRVINPFL